MRKFFSAFFLSAFLVVPSTSLWAQDDVGTVTTAEEAEVTRDVFESPWSVTPRVGSLGYQDNRNEYTGRIMEGITTNFNFAAAGMPTGWNLGMETGFLFSHVGSAGSNWLGSESGNGTSPGANSFIVPVHAVMGYMMSDTSLVAINLGTSLLYRSVANSMIVGRDDGSTDDSLEFFPSAGLNFGWELSRSVGFSLRGDYIPTSSDDMYTASLGATFALG